MYFYNYSAFYYFAAGVAIGWGLGYIIGPPPPGPGGTGTS
jgi:hypothetical protein